MAKWDIPSKYWDILKQDNIDKIQKMIEKYKSSDSFDITGVMNKLEGIIPLDLVDISEIIRYQNAVDKNLFQQNMDPMVFCGKTMEPWDALHYRTLSIDDWSDKRLSVDKTILSFLNKESKFKIKLHKHFFEEEQDPGVDRTINFYKSISVEVEVNANDLMIWKLSQG